MRRVGPFPFADPGPDAGYREAAPAQLAISEEAETANTVTAQSRLILGSTQ